MAKVRITCEDPRDIKTVKVRDADTGEPIPTRAARFEFDFGDPERRGRPKLFMELVDGLIDVVGEANLPERPKILIRGADSQGCYIRLAIDGPKWRPEG